MGRVIFKLKHDIKKALNNNQFKLMVSFFLFVSGFLCAKRDGGTGQMENTFNNCTDKIKAIFSLYSLRGMFLLFLINRQWRSKQTLEINPGIRVLSCLLLYLPWSNRKLDTEKLQGQDLSCYVQVSYTRKKSVVKASLQNSSQ